MTISPNLQRRLDQALATWPRWKVDLRSPPVVVSELPGGLSNYSFVVLAGEGRAVVRINSARDHVFNIDRHRECRVLSCIEGESFSPEVWFCDVVSGVLVTKFIDGEPLSIEEVNDSRVRFQIAAILARMAEINVPELPVFDYPGHLRHYRRQVLALYPGFPEELNTLEVLYRQYETAIEQFQSADWEPSLVHHDLIPANIIRSDSGLRIIDWEYAANGYAPLDSMLWSSGDDPSQRLIAIYSKLINGYWYLLKEAEPGR